MSEASDVYVRGRIPPLWFGFELKRRGCCFCFPAQTAAGEPGASLWKPALPQQLLIYEQQWLHNDCLVPGKNSFAGGVLGGGWCHMGQ